MYMIKFTVLVVMAILFTGRGLGLVHVIYSKIVYVD